MKKLCADITRRDSLRLLGLISLSQFPLFSTAVWGQRAADLAVGGQAQNDGEALFKAIFFLDGSMTDQVPELTRLKSLDAMRSMTRKQEAALATFHEKLIQGLKRTDPNFFAHFATSIRSGDRVKISEALNSASRQALGVVQKENPEAAKFLTRNQSRLQGAISSTLKDTEAKGSPPDLTKIDANLRGELSQLKDRKLEFAWLKGTSGGTGASEPNQPDTDHSIAVIPYTFVAVVVILAVLVWVFKAESAGGDLYREKLVDSLAVKLRT